MCELNKSFSIYSFIVCTVYCLCGVWGPIETLSGISNAICLVRSGQARPDQAAVEVRRREVTRQETRQDLSGFRYAYQLLETINLLLL